MLIPSTSANANNITSVPTVVLPNPIKDIIILPPLASKGVLILPSLTNDPRDVKFLRNDFCLSFEDYHKTTIYSIPQQVPYCDKIHN